MAKPVSTSWSTLIVGDYPWTILPTTNWYEPFNWPFTIHLLQLTNINTIHSLTTASTCRPRLRICGSALQLKRASGLTESAMTCEWVPSFDAPASHGLGNFRCLGFQSVRSGMLWRVYLANHQTKTWVSTKMTNTVSRRTNKKVLNKLRVWIVGNNAGYSRS